MRLVSETLLRNLVPGIALVSSAYVNYRLTKRLGDSVRCYMRYQRALQDAFTRDTALLSNERELLTEGIWFVFSADGALNAEETLLLASLLNGLSREYRDALIGRFTIDEQDWLERIQTRVPSRRAAPF